MASLLKEKITGSLSGGENGDDKDKYRLAVSASTTYDDSTSKQIVINGPPSEVNERIKVAVRIKEHQGLPLDSPPSSPYFEDAAHSKDTYSIAVSWIPDEDVEADDVVWGIELINPIRDRIPKRFITAAFDIVKGFVDPSLRCDPYADEPWLNGPVLCSTAITWSIGERDSCHVADILSEGASGSGASVRDQHRIPPTEDKRRKHFSDTAHRKDFVFEKGRCYSFDFHNGYIDWKNYALKLPGFSLGALKYVSDKTHTLRFVLKNRKRDELCVATTFRLLFGDELQQAIEADKSKSSESRNKEVDARDPRKGNRDVEQKAPAEARKHGQPENRVESNVGNEPKTEPKSNPKDEGKGQRHEPVTERKEAGQHVEHKDSIEESLMATASKDNRT